MHNYAPRDLAAAVAFLDECAGAGRLPLLARLTSPPVPLARIEEALALARSGAFARVLIAEGGGGEEAGLRS